jgi:hypothetical protein
MGPVIIALHHGTLLRKLNLFFSYPTPPPLSTFTLFFILLALLLLDFFDVGLGLGVWSFEKER